MKDAKWLFSNHRWLKGQLQLLLIQQEAQQEQSEWQKDEAIASIVLTRPEFSSVHSNSNKGSSTEHAALHWQDEMPCQEADQAALEKKIKSYQYNLKLYDIVISYLTSEEAWFVEKYYEQQIPIAQLCDMPGSPFSLYSKSTIYRCRDRILAKADRFLKNAII